MTVRTKSVPPLVIDVAGLRLVVAGSGLLNVRVLALEMPPTGTGVDTVIWALPADAMSVAGIAAVNFVAETKVVVRPNPPHCTTDRLTKRLPVTVRVKAAPQESGSLG